MTRSEQLEQIMHAILQPGDKIVEWRNIPVDALPDNLFLMASIDASRMAAQTGGFYNPQQNATRGI